MASDFYDLRPEQVPNAVTQSFPNVHFLAKSSTVLSTRAKRLPAVLALTQSLWDCGLRSVTVSKMLIADGRARQHHQQKEGGENFEEGQNAALHITSSQQGERPRPWRERS